MLYIGHFFFDVDESYDSQQYGHLTCVAKAKNRDAAVGVFKALLETLHAHELLFNDGIRTRVYLDVCVELLSSPSAGILCHYESAGGRPPVTLALDLVGAAKKVADSFDLQPEGKTEMEEFLVFEHL